MKIKVFLRGFIYTLAHARGRAGLCARLFFPKLDGCGCLNKVVVVVVARNSGQSDLEIRVCGGALFSVTLVAEMIIERDIIQTHTQTGFSIRAIARARGKMRRVDELLRGWL